MRSCTSATPIGLPICLLAVGLATAQNAIALNLHSNSISTIISTTATSNTNNIELTGSQHSRLLDKCCRVGAEKALELRRNSCKMDYLQAMSSATPHGLTSSESQLFAREPDIGEQCELLLESCCLSEHRKRNCDSGKQFAKSGSACMDVELSKEATIATESFNDCCMSCSLGILAAKTSKSTSRVNETILTTNLLIDRCKLMNPLANSLSGQLYEQTYIECCQENLPRQSNPLTEPGQAIDCARSNPCSQRCIRALKPNHQDRCDCFVGYKLSPDGINCEDIDECKLNQHSCNRRSEICDNVPGGFRCMARMQQQSQQNLDQAIRLRSQIFGYVK